MNERPMMPEEISKIRSAIKSGWISNHSQSLENKVNKLRTLLNKLSPEELSAWDIESLKMVNEILGDEKIQSLRREIKSVMKSVGKDYEIEKILWQKKIK
jgi:ferredoxin-fold anticodon binding domain-containing protein